MIISTRCVWGVLGKWPCIKHKKVTIKYEFDTRLGEKRPKFRESNLHLRNGKHDIQEMQNKSAKRILHA